MDIAPSFNVTPGTLPRHSSSSDGPEAELSQHPHKLNPWSHVHRSLWILIQDIDKAKGGFSQPDHRYGTCQTRIKTINELCNHHALQRTTKTNRQPHAAHGKDLYVALSNAFHSNLRISKEYRFEDIWRLGSSCCDPETIKKYKTAYHTLAQQATSHACIPSETTQALKQHGRHRESSTELQDRRSPRKLAKAQYLDPDETSRESSLSRWEAATTISDTSRQEQSRLLDLGAAAELAPNLTPKDVEEDMSAINNSLRQAVMNWVDYFGLIGRDMPVTPTPNQALASLYESLLHDTEALVAAFLFDKVFNVELPSESDPADDNVSFSQSGLAILDQESSEDLNIYAQRLTAELLPALDLLVSEFGNLSRMKWHVPPQSDRSDLTFRLSLKDAVEKIIKQAVCLKIKLGQSDMEPRFIWPKYGEPMDSSKMSVGFEQNDSTTRTTVAFVKFPGVSVRYMEGGKQVTDYAYKANVVIQYS
ncbi:hypothetical protein Q7P37_004199 [Cladosporium fusiforme]